MSQFLPDQFREQETKPTRTPEQGPESYLSPEERKFWQRGLGFPEDFPPKFKSWLIDFIAVNIPQIPIGQIVGMKQFQPSESIVYTPTWTSSGTQPSLGNGTLTGSYLRTGKLLLGQLSLTLGSTSTTGTGRWQFSTPVPIVQNSIFGTGYINDVGVALHMLFVHPESTSAFALRETDATLVDANNPFISASGDTLNVSFACQAS